MFIGKLRDGNKKSNFMIICKFIDCARSLRLLGLFYQSTFLKDCPTCRGDLLILVCFSHHASVVQTTWLLRPQGQKVFPGKTKQYQGLRYEPQVLVLRHRRSWRRRWGWRRWRARPSRPRKRRRTGFPRIRESVELLKAVDQLLQSSFDYSEDYFISELKIQCWSHLFSGQFRPLLALGLYC